MSVDPMQLNQIEIYFQSPIEVLAVVVASLLLLGLRVNRLIYSSQCGKVIN